MGVKIKREEREQELVQGFDGGGGFSLLDLC